MQTSWKNPRPTHGFLDASSDPASIEEWLRIYPGCNWGMKVGPESGSWVLDIDPAGLPWVEMQQRLHGDHWLQTRKVKTGRGGFHAHYTWPTGATPLSNLIGILASGVDVVANTQVVIPPSIHENGQPYFFLTPSSLQPSPTPPWLLESIMAAAEKKPANGNGSGGHIFVPGERNNRLCSIAGSLRNKGLAAEVIDGALQVINEKSCSPPLAPAEVTGIADSVGSYKAPPQLRIREIKVKPAEETPSRITAIEQIPDVRSLPNTPVRWLVEDLLPQNQVVLLAGEYSVGKSYLALLMSAALVRGEKFLGRDTMRQDVVYLDRENPAAVIRERVENIYSEDEISHRHWGSWLAEEAPELSDERLLAFADQGAVLIFDSLIRFHGADENSPTQMAAVMQSCRRLQSRGASVLLLHHRPKDLSAGFRGSSEIAAGCDLLYSLSKTRDTGVLQLETVKDRLGICPRLTFRADWAAGTVTPIELSETLQKRDLVTRIRRLIEDSPGIRQGQIVTALSSDAVRSQLQRVLAQGDGQWWRTDRTGTTTSYFPRRVLRIGETP